MRTKAWFRVLVLAALPALSAVYVHEAAYAQPATAASPSPEALASAKEHFEKAMGFYKKDDFKSALEEFRVSYAAVNSPNSHLYIARCLVSTGDVRAGYLEYEKVIAEAAASGDPKYAPTGETAKTEQEELKSKLAFVTVNVTSPDPSARLTVGGEEVPRDSWGKPIPVQPGAVDVVLESPNAPPSRQSLTFAAGEQRTVDVAGEVAPPPPVETGNKAKTLRIAAYAAGGVGAAGLIMFGVAGAMTNATYSKLEDECGKDRCPQRLADDVSAGKTQQTVANVGLVIGAVGLAAGATLFIFSRRADKASAGSAQTQLLVGPSYLGVRGAF